MDRLQQPGPKSWTRGLASLALTLAIGAAISSLLIKQALSTVSLDWRVDAEVGVMVIVLLAPAGISWVCSARALMRPWSRWSSSDLLWLAISLVEVAWCGVLLDGGARLGQAGKFLSGATAFLGAPLVAIVAVALALRMIVNHPARQDAWQRCSILAGLVAGIGWGLFLWVMLPLRF